MNQPTDILGKDLNVGDHVGCAFSYSQASVGHIRIGVIEEIFIDKQNYYSSLDEIFVKIRWDDSQKLSPKMKYGSHTRWIKL